MEGNKCSDCLVMGNLSSSDAMAFVSVKLQVSTATFSPKRRVVFSQAVTIRPSEFADDNGISAFYRLLLSLKMSQ